MLDTLLLNDEPICDRCQIAFWRNMGLPVRDAPLPKGRRNAQPRKTEFRNAACINPYVHRVGETAQMAISTVVTYVSRDRQGL
jgi:hypothetical protein